MVRRIRHRWLFPAVLNLATMADISANATCGTRGPEMFCKLVEHVPGQPSPSIKNGMEYHYVTVTLDLKQGTVAMASLLSLHCGNWILERSLDGVNYDPWQYYAITDTECLTRFNLKPSPRASVLHPGQRGHLHLLLLQDPPAGERRGSVLLLPQS
ncbi:hypothetical protein CRUP_037920 [Coryphaenoides rupestris]|nr:hypothetical protein CRUP_037920 [Coryphaenoides rupestris]